MRYANKLLNKKTEDGPRTDVSDVITSTYNIYGDLSAIRMPDNNEYVYGYVGVNDRPETITDPNGNITGYEYDDKNRIHKETQNKNGTNPLVTSYRYNGQDQITRITMPNRFLIENTYDAAGRLIRKTTNNEVAPPNVKKWTDYKYDKLSKLTDINDIFALPPRPCPPTPCVGSPQQTITRVKNGYDPLGNLASTEGASGRRTTFTYDANVNLETVTDG